MDVEPAIPQALAQFCSSPPWGFMCYRHWIKISFFIHTCLKKNCSNGFDKGIIEERKEGRDRERKRKVGNGEKQADIKGYDR